MNALEVVRSLPRMVAVGLVATWAAQATAQTEGDATLGSRKPTVGVVNPWNGVVTLPFRVQVRVFSPKTSGGATQAIGAVTLQYTGPVSGSITLSQNTKYGSATDSGIWEGQLDSTKLTVVGTYGLRASATNGTGTVWSGPITVTVNPGRGDGNLLVRDNADQLCSDCHAHQTHSSEATGPKYGSWYAGCRTCHQPHDTVNASLIANQIDPPDVAGAYGPTTTRFANRRGYVASGGVGNPGAASYAGGDASGPCQVCHTRTSVFRRDGSLTSHNGNELKACGTCHSHKKGFNVDCAGCHGAAGGRTSAIAGATDPYLSFAPPVTPTTTAPIVASGGVHLAHLNKDTYRRDALACAECHLNYGHGDADVDLDWGTLTIADGATASPAAGVTTAAWVSNPTCTNYCHGATLADGSPATKVAVKWNTAQTLTCGSCHGNPPTLTHSGSAHPLATANACTLCHPGYTVPLGATAKTTHIDGAATGKACTDCHGDAARVLVSGASADARNAPPKSFGGTTADAITVRGVGVHQVHVNDAASVAIPIACAECHPVPNAHDGTGAQEAEVVFGTLAKTGGMAATWTYPSCSSVYCHNPTPATPGTTPAPSFYAAAALGCTGCHDDAATLTTGSHAGHVADAGSYKGTTFGCVTCHDHTTNSSIPAANKAKHVNGLKDVSAPSWNGTACASNYCHSNGTETPDYVAATWGGTLANDCKQCHGAEVGGIAGAPWYANNTGSFDTRNSHAKHVASAADCVKCHAGTVTAAGALIPGGTLHLDGARSVSGASIGAYDEATETCSSIACHGGGSAQWGATLGCGDCHGTAGRVKTIAGTVDANLISSPPVDTAGSSTSQRVGPHLKHVDSDAYRTNGLACAECHPAAVQHNGTRDAAWGSLASAGGAVPTPAAGNGAYSAAWETTPTCVNYCHGATLAGETVTAQWSAAGVTAFGAAAACTQCHGASPATSGTPAVVHPTNVACASCHGAGYLTTGLTAAAKVTHVNGSSAGGTDKPNNGCTACHGVLAGATAAAVPNTSMTSAPGYGGTGVDAAGNTAVTVVQVGAHDAHVRPSGSLNAVAALDCASCHGTKPVSGDRAHANNTVAVGWSTLATGGGTVTPAPAAFNAAFETTPSCTNYCHSNASPLGGTLSTPAFTWTSAANLTCASCHATGTFGGTGLSAKHGKHLTGYGYTCDECHATTVANDSSSVIGTVANHVNGAKDWRFSTTGTPASIDQSGGAYAGSPGYGCTATYCHSNGTTAVAPFGATANATALSWSTGTTAAACDNCHGGNSSATYKMATGAHGAHVNNATYLGANFGCVTCHDATVDADRTLDVATGYANHVNGLKDVSAPSWSGTACASNYCHSNGTETLVAADYKSVAWSGTLANDCLGCHGSFSPAAFTAVYGEPNYANDTASVKTRNSHAKHVSPVLATAKTQCVSCHAGTVDATGALLAAGAHLDNARSVSGASIGAYDEATETCSNVACHGNKNAQWGATLGCGDCHGTAGRVKTIAGTVDANLISSPPVDTAGSSTSQRVGPHLKHVDSDAYRTNGLGCAECHPGTVQHNGTRDAAWGALAAANGAVPTPAAGNGAYSAAWETTPTCVNYCHGATLAGETVTAQWSAAGVTAFGAAAACTQCHGASPATSGTPAVVHPTNVACASCHGAGYLTTGLTAAAKVTHVNGSSAGGTDKPNNGCTACHGVLAGATAAAVPNTSMTSAPGYGGTGVDAAGNTAVTVVQVGAHDAHVRDEGAANLVAPLDCSNCHGTKPAAGDRVHANNTVALGWSAIATGNGIVASPTPAAFNATFEATPSCTNYCHSNAKPLGQASATLKTVTWTSATGMSCTSCHETAVFGGTGLSPKHQTHVSTYGYGCVRCHVNSAASNTAIVTGGGQHVDGTRDVDFDTSGPNNSGGTYSYAGYTCSNTYCHSSGASRTAPYVSGPSVAWNGTTSCVSCHGSGTTMVNQAHGAHTNQASVYGTTFGCQTCHTGTSSDGTTVTTIAKHVNFAADVDAGLTYAAGGCTTYCHSSGKKLATETGPYAYVTNMVWTSTAYNGCGQCHGAFTGVINATKFGEPNYDNLGVSSYQANTHFQHVGAETACYSCHRNTVTAAGNVIASPALHMNGVADISIDPTLVGTYTPRSGASAPGCSNVSCHDNPLVASQWGGTIAEGPCSECHTQAGAGNGDVDNFVFQTAPRAMVDVEDYSTYGHGRTTAFDTAVGLSGNAGPGMTYGGAMTNEGCFYCHTPKVALAAGKEAVSHGQPANPFRLANTAVGGKTWGKNGACLVCHASDATGFDPDGTTTNYASKIASAAARVSATHYGSDHAAGGKGGEFCWDCHDPHGDYNYTSSKPIAYMIHEKPIRTHELMDPNGWGVPDATEFVTNPVEFNAALTGGATTWDGTDYTDTGAAPYNGVCQVCHTSASTLYHRADGTGKTHMTGSQCTKCHSHSNASQADAFKEAVGCNDCHYTTPAASGEHALHVGAAAATAAYGSTAPASTSTQYGYNCGKCHTTVATNHYNDHGGGTATPYAVNVGFDWTSGATPYALGTASNDTHATSGLVFKTTTGTCNTYCHSNADPVDLPAARAMVYQTAVWDAAQTYGCTACHGGKDAATTMSATHAKHVNTTGYGYACQKCHQPTTTDGTITNESQHVDGDKQDVGFDSLNPAGTYSGGTWTCNSVYCHSSGEATPAYKSPKWTDAVFGTDCAGCHGGNATSSAILITNEHGEHVNKLAYLGTNFTCGRCHSSTVTSPDDRTVTTPANHLNGSREVSMPDGGTWTAAGKTCTSTYCHSDGTETPGYIAGLDWDFGQTVTDDCKACHGTAGGAFVSTYGEPNYTERVTTSDDVRNSHSKHVGTNLAVAKTQCVDCHDAAINADGSLKNGGTHLNKSVEVTFGAGKKILTYNPSGESCGTISCHGGGNAVWGGTLDCLGCHSGTDGGALGDGVGNAVDDEWALASNGGHGGAATGGFTSVLNGCDYCHDIGSAHTPVDATNPYRLRYSATANTLCLQCHLTGDAGININSAGTALALENSTKNVDAAHDGAEHSAGEGGMLCWDCHDPHGVPTNIRMIKRSASKTADQYGVPLTTATVTFTSTTCTAAGAGCFVEATNNPRQGVCQACHDPLGTSSYWRWDGTGNGHNPTAAVAICSGCHQHKAKFKGQGGGSDCYGCHFDGEGTRRRIDADFTKQSHHVRGTMSSAGTGQGVGNNYDCVVCHSEGQIITAASGDCQTGPFPTTCSNTAWHANGKIDLRDVDTAAPATDTAGTATYVYDKGAVATAAGAVANWGSQTQIWREWTSGVDETGGATLPAKAGLDKFCLGCHDANGASQISTFRVSTETGRTALNPFFDDLIANSYDGLTRCDGPPATAGGKPTCVTPNTIGRVTNIKDKVSGNPPPQGTYSRHAIRGQSTSPYCQPGSPGCTSDATGDKMTGSCTTGSKAPYFTNCTIWQANGFTNPGNDERGFSLWRDSSVMGCADCHTVDGANGAAGNAHGSGSEYLLKDNVGGAAEGTKSGVNYVCYRCHNTASSLKYTGTPHTGSNSDWVDSTGASGATRVGSNANWAGLTCGACHGTSVFGGIHGSSETLGTGQNGGTGTRQAYRFTNGADLRFYDPGGWNTSSATCYTLGTDEAAWGACTQHNNGNSRTKGLVRPLTY